MYILEGFENGAAHITNSSNGYNSAFNAASRAEGESIAVSLNQADMISSLAAYRFNFEVGGLDLGGGVRLLTDRESQGQVANAFVSLTNNLIPDTPFKAATGFEAVTSDQIKPIAKAVAAHSRACFSGEESVAKAIKSAETLSAISDIDVPALFKMAYTAAYEEVMGPAGA